MKRQWLCGLHRCRIPPCHNCDASCFFGAICGTGPNGRLTRQSTGPAFGRPVIGNVGRQRERRRAHVASCRLYRRRFTFTVQWSNNLSIRRIPIWSGPAHEAPASIKTPGDAEDGVAILVHRRTEPFIGRPMILVSAVAQGAGESKCSVSSSAPPRTEWPVALRRHRAGRRQTPGPFRYLLVSATLLTPNPSFQRTAFGSR